MFSRAISTSVVRYMRANRPTPTIIKEYPITLRLLYPSWDLPILHEFSSEAEITEFLSEYKKFLINPDTRLAIRANQVHEIDPNITYEVAGSGLPPYRELKGLSREQIWDSDTVFEKKTALALQEALKREDPNLVQLPRIIKDSEGRFLHEWEGSIFQLSDGTVVFLETKYRMTMSHIDNQPERVSKSLKTMGKYRWTFCSGWRPSVSRLYLAAYHWPEEEDDDCISYARSKGYGIIKPNGLDVTVDVQAQALFLK